MRFSEITDAALAAETEALERRLSENASAGSTSAASVAVSVGGIGMGFDPRGDKGIYQGKPKKKAKTEEAMPMIRRISESQSYPEMLHTGYEIAQVFCRIQPDYGIALAAREFEDCYAILREVPTYDLTPGAEGEHERFPEKERAYMAMKPETMPPLFVRHGEIIDGNHRYRVGKAQGKKSFLCYVIYEDMADE